VLDEAEIANGRTVPAELEYQRDVQATVFRREVDVYPIIHRWPTLEVEFDITGPKENNLDWQVLRPTVAPGGERGAPLDRRETSPSHVKSGLAMPGEMVLLTWRPTLPAVGPEPTQNAEDVRNESRRWRAFFGRVGKKQPAVDSVRTPAV